MPLKRWSAHFCSDVFQPTRKGGNRHVITSRSVCHNQCTPSTSFCFIPLVNMKEILNLKVRQGAILWKYVINFSVHRYLYWKVRPYEWKSCTLHTATAIPEEYKMGGNYKIAYFSVTLNNSTVLHRKVAGFTCTIS